MLKVTASIRKNMKNRQVVFFFLAAIMAACTPVVKLKYGITKPKDQTPASIVKYLTKHDYPLNNQFILKDSAAFIMLMKDSAFMKMVLRTNLFQGDFQRIVEDTSKCQWSGGYFIRHLKADSSYEVAASFPFDSLFALLRPLFDTTALPVVKKGDFDFIVLNTWAMFIGTMNERLFATVEPAKERSDLKILVLNLNLDMQDEWALKDDNRIKFK